MLLMDSPNHATIPDLTTRTNRARNAGSVLPAVLGIAVVLGVALAWSYGRFGSLNHALLYAQGLRVALERTVVDLPDGQVGESRAAEVPVHNLSSETVTVLGASVSCDCVTTEGVPLKIPAGASAVLRSAVKLDGRFVGPFQQSVTYYTDHPTAPNLKVVLKGKVIAPAE